ncbi:MAG: DUF393 domain-containing protein [Elusimicrobiota bacterium]
MNPPPAKPLVVYDGECGFCTGSLRWLKRLDWLRRFDALPYQSAEVYRRFPQLRREDCTRELHLCFANGDIYKGGDAIGRILLRLPLTFPLGALASLPPLAAALRAIYPAIACRR